MKQAVLFILVHSAFFLVFRNMCFAQNHINELVTEHELCEADALVWLGSMKQTKSSIRTLDSLNIGMIIARGSLAESVESDPMITERTYYRAGSISGLLSDKV